MLLLSIIDLMFIKNHKLDFVLKTVPDVVYVIHMMELVNVTLDGTSSLIVQSNKHQFAQVTVMETEYVKLITLVPVTLDSLELVVLHVQMYKKLQVVNTGRA